MLIPFNFGSYFVCMLLAIGYVMMAAGFSCESDAEHQVAAVTIDILFGANHTFHFRSDR